jgi:hypothetical protein
VAAFCALGLPQALAEGPQSAAQLAAQGFGDEAKLFRLLRALAAYDVVRYTGEGRFALGHVGKGLTGKDSAAPMVLYANAAWHIQGYGHLADAVRAPQSGFELAHGMPMFEYFEKEPQAGALFDAAMQSLAPMFARAFVRAYDFSNSAHIVDMGGGTGALLAMVLERFPALRGTVFELPAVANRARNFARVAGLSARLNVCEGSILTDVPPPADAYIFSHILHDWDDEPCVRMLKNVRRVMPADARVLVYEVVAAPPNNRWSQDRIQDLEMLAILPGRERTRKEYKTLFERSNLRLARIIPTAAAESIIEAAAAS